jgi:hypothetical protein
VQACDIKLDSLAEKDAIVGNTMELLVSLERPHEAIFVRGSHEGNAPLDEAPPVFLSHSNAGPIPNAALFVAALQFLRLIWFDSISLSQLHFGTQTWCLTRFFTSACLCNNRLLS